jgi:DNA-binding NarL/FixJ family response regulator
MPASRIRVLLADGQPMLRTGFRTVLGAEPDLDVVGEAGDGPQAVDLARRLRPDLVLMDLLIPRQDGVATTRALAGVAVLLLLPGPPDDEPGRIRGALAAGARGLLSRDVPAPTLVAAIRAIAAGAAVVAPSYLALAGSGPPAAADPPPRRAMVEVTDREREVLVQVARGLSNAEIAAQLGVSETTVKTHVGRLLAKVGARDRAQAVIYAYETGLIHPTPQWTTRQ